MEPKPGSQERHRRMLDLAHRLISSENPARRSIAETIYDIVQTRENHTLTRRPGEVTVEQRPDTGKPPPSIRSKLTAAMGNSGIDPTPEERKTGGEALRLSTNSGKAPATHIECVACGYEKPAFDVVQLACRPEPHVYCRECLEKMFENAMEDKTSFPPTCCRVPIPMEVCHHFFSIAFVERFKKKTIEVGTPNRTYCANLSCGQFIPPKYYEGHLARCPACRGETCRMCKAHGHQGLCPDDPSTKGLMDVAAANNWQTCPSCKTMVERTSGCNHIRCRCGADFCYQCGNGYVQDICSCPLFGPQNYIIQPYHPLLAPHPMPQPPMWFQFLQQMAAAEAVRRDVEAQNLADVIAARERQGRAPGHVDCCSTTNVSGVDIDNAMIALEDEVQFAENSSH
ncbi:hypothetical protein BU16DRAFT_536713 [Lophium mytilinum]|uniref:RBR-type E3 ubiquitin transferase n=1 Tax=Lophium mytilinum TaxID=390894 RepID=A0A6A6R2E1_9PEZI|nr:hypothetical protein BU16DRAFT_536713 [Lophium mytilinum]